MAKSRQAKRSSQPAKPAAKTNTQARKPVAKKRGALLSVLLVLVAVHGILAILLVWDSLQAGYDRSSPWVILVLAVVYVAAVVSAVAMWYWKKWGIGLFTIVCFVQAGVHMLLTGSLLVAIYDILPAAVLGYVINLQLKRDLFE